MAAQPSTPTAVNFTSHDSIYNTDWVSSIHLSQQWILSGCFDNSISIHNIHGDDVFKVDDHCARVRKVLWVNNSDPSKGFLSAGDDCLVMLWDWDTRTKKAQRKIKFAGHKRSILSLDVNPDGSEMVTGGSDMELNVWTLGEMAEEPVKKKWKGVMKVGPVKCLGKHKETVTSLIWLEKETVCSSSMDHTVKFWDVECSVEKFGTVEQKPFLGASWSALSRTLLTCSADNYIRLYDPRTEGLECAAIFDSNSWVSAVSWCKEKCYYFASAGYDNMVKIWDSRNCKSPLNCLSGHGGQVLCVDWSTYEYVVSGAVDNLICIFRNKQIN